MGQANSLGVGFSPMQFNATTTSAVRTLTDLPNISFLLGEDLAKLDITIPKRLIEVGAERVWDRLHAAGLHADAHVLLSLEGAIMRLPWQSIPAERRLQLLRHAMAR